MMHEPFAFSYASLLRMRTAEALKRDREGQTEHKEKQREECLLRADPFQLIGGANSFREFAPTMSGALCFSYV